MEETKNPQPDFPRLASVAGTLKSTPSFSTLQIGMVCATLLIIAALFLFRGRIAGDDPPGPRSPDAVAAAAIETYAASLADVFDQAAGLAAGCKSNAEFLEQVKSLTTAARVKAFAEFDQVTNAAIGEDRWDPARAAALARQFAAGFRQ